MKGKRWIAVIMALVMVAALSSAAFAAEEESKLVLGLDGQPTNLALSGMVGGAAGGFLTYTIYEHLWYYDCEAELHLRLAEAYEFDEDANTVTITLRDGGSFSNGDPITAEDVLFSVVAFSNGVKPLADIDCGNSYVADEKTVVLALTEASNNNAALEQIATVGIISQDYTDNFSNEMNVYTSPLCSGPYFIAEPWVSGNPIQLEKNPDYWDADSFVYDKIEVQFINEETTRYLSFKSGETDICYLSESANIDLAVGDGVNLFQHPMQSGTSLAFDTQNCDTFANQNLRLALCYSVDVEAIVANICGSSYVPATSILSSENWAYKDMSYGYDPDLAMEYYNAYVEETGNETTEFTLVIQEGVMADVAEALQYFFEQLPGVTMHVDVVDNATFFARLISEVFELSITTFTGASEPAQILDQLKSTSMAATAKTPADLQEMIDAACFTNEDESVRQEMWYEVQDALHDFGKFLPLYEGSFSFAQDGDILSVSSVNADGAIVPFGLK